MITLRKTLAVLSLWLPPLVVLITWLAWRDRLPIELPTHWSGSGPADASTRAETFWFAIFFVTAVAALVGSVAILIRLSGSWTQRAVAALTGGVSAFAASIWIGSSAPAIDVVDPLTVHLGAWILLALFSPLYGLVQLGLLPPGKEPRTTDVPVDIIAPLEVESGQTVAWSRTMTSWLFIGITILMAALTGGIAFSVLRQEGGTAVVVVLVVMTLSTLLVAMFCRFRITVDWRGLRVTSMLLGLPLKRIRADQIEKVEAAIIDPMQWGGWGYRIMPGASALVLRKGPGLIITQTDTRQFAVTLDSPEEPASVLMHVVSASSPTSFHDVSRNGEQTR